MLGIDIGSSTAKIALLDKNKKLVYKKYMRHNGKVKESLYHLLYDLKDILKDKKIKFSITGTAGMGIANRNNFEFIQEVIAISKVIKTFYNHVHTLIELGGEDAKIILFEEGKTPEMRMNGSCAGGTGSFIDQMATLLNTTPSQLNELSKNPQKSYILLQDVVFLQKLMYRHY